MNITHILLGSTAAMLIAALILSYSAMKGGEAEDGRRTSAKALMEENFRLQAEIARMRTNQAYGGITASRDTPRKHVRWKN